MLFPQLLLVPSRLLPSHHSQRRIDKSGQSGERRPSEATAPGNTFESLLPSYPERDRRLVLEALGLSESAWRRHAAGGGTGISAGDSKESLTVDWRVSQKEGGSQGGSPWQRRLRWKMKPLGRGLRKENMLVRWIGRIWKTTVSERTGIVPVLLRSIGWQASPIRTTFPFVKLSSGLRFICVYIFTSGLFLIIT